MYNPYTTFVVVFSVDSIIYMQDNSPNYLCKLFNVLVTYRESYIVLVGFTALQEWNVIVNKGAAKLTENCFRNNEKIASIDSRSQQLFIWPHTA